MAENDNNDPRVVSAPDVGGFGLDCHWLDDFHHALYVILHKEGKKEYEDFGSIEQLAKAYTDGFVHSGEYVRFRKRKHGASSIGVSGDKFVAFIQNHDQVGNKVGGKRLSAYMDCEQLKIAVAALLFSPYIPLLFMGEEYAEDNPFLYFTSHSDKELVKAVREGRKREFEHYYAGEEMPDPQALNSFNNSKLNWDKRNSTHHYTILHWYRELLSIRRKHKALTNFDKKDLRVNILEDGLILHRQSADGKQAALIFFNFSSRVINCVIPYSISEMKLLLNSKDSKWQVEKSETTEVPPIIKDQQKVQLPPFCVLAYSNTTVA